MFKLFKINKKTKNKEEKEYYNNSIKVYKKLNDYKENLENNIDEKFDVIFPKLLGDLIEIKIIINLLKICIKNNFTPTYSIFYRFMERNDNKIDKDDKITDSRFLLKAQYKNNLNVDNYIKNLNLIYSKKEKNENYEHLSVSFLNIWELCINKFQSKKEYLIEELTHQFKYNYNINNDYLSNEDHKKNLIDYAKKFINEDDKKNDKINDEDLYNIIESIKTKNSDPASVSKYNRKVTKIFAELSNKFDKENEKIEFFNQKFIDAENKFAKINESKLMKTDFITPRKFLSNSIRLTTKKISPKSRNRTKKHKFFKIPNFLKRRASKKMSHINTSTKFTRSKTRSRSRSRSPK